MTNVMTIIDHGEAPHVRALRRRRLQIALAVAAVEGILVLAGSIPWWVVALAAVAAFALRLALRDARARVVGQLTWIAAVSQLVVVLVPVAAAIVTVLAVAVVVLVAVVALGALLRDRR